MEDLIEVEFDKIVCEGKTLGRKNGKVVFAYGVLPGERAKVRKKMEKKNYIEGEVVEILSQSPYRIKPMEEHFLSCSPWQIINYDKQIEYKKRIILEGFYQSMKESVFINKFYPAIDVFSYRTKIEYSFLYDDRIYLAFHKRGDYSTKVKLPYGCMLINDMSNSIALKFVDFLNTLNLEPSVLKSFVVRYSFLENKCLTILFVKDETITFDFPLFSDFHKGHITVYSKPQSSVSSVDKVISIKGEQYISESIYGKKIDYGFDCFFQNNIYLFQEAVSDIKRYTKGFDKIVDLYSGVGVIGIVCGDLVSEIFFVDSSASSINFAKKNVFLNDIKAKTVFLNIPSEEIDVDVLRNSCLVVDPPRPGMHKKLIKKILMALPPRIIYLSCNPVTQGRDLVHLLEKYKIVEVFGYDFYPNTPHVESLVIMDRK